LIPYTYPKVSHVPTLLLGSQPEDCHAFRVDVTATVVDMGETDDYLLAPLPVWPTGLVPSPTSVSLEYGMHVIGPLTYLVGHMHTTMVRLYRRGYELAEVGSWQVHGITWKEAKDPTAQEKAVDDLLGAPAVTYLAVMAQFTQHRDGGTDELEKEPWTLGGLKSGSASEGQRETLLFAAAEYEHIARAASGSAENSMKVRQRAAAKAAWLRDLAKK
jgi:hypothetical protein